MSSSHLAHPVTSQARPRTRRDRRQALVPSELWRMLACESAMPKRLPAGLDAAWNAAVGRAMSIHPRRRRYLREADAVVAREGRYANIGDRRLREALSGMRERFRLGRQRRDDVREAFAMVREAAVRAVGLRPHPVQVAAGLAIHDGCVAELATGEGKTLVASMPAVVAGWRGRGCHVVTFNDYLAARDAGEMAPIYALCGLRVAHLEADMTPEDRRWAYQADVTYGTSRDVAADFLRDRLALGRRTGLAAFLLADLVDGRGSGMGRLMMRGLDTAIVDEADSVLIDEAVTPLLISGDAPNAAQVEAYETAAWLARELEANTDYTVDQRHREIHLTRAGLERLEQKSARRRGPWGAAGRRPLELVTQALTARELFLRNHHYVIEGDRVVIVDESTGRLMPDRMWRAGIHQAVEAKEGLPVNPPKETMARVSFQRFFRLYGRLGGMTGTGREARHELWQVYGLPVVVLPTHRPCRRIQKPDRLFPDEQAKWRAVLDEIATVHASGRPILVGTRNVETSEHLSAQLHGAGLAHEVLNATRHAEEARIVALAGEWGRITVATNMAGRGTDIKLGPGVAEQGGLHVIATERHESGRIDRQLFGRAARQGDPGSAVAFASLEDLLCRRHVPAAVRRLAGRRGSAPLSRVLVAGAQRRARRLAARQRRILLRTDDWLDRFLGFAGRGS